MYKFEYQYSPTKFTISCLSDPSQPRPHLFWGVTSPQPIKRVISRPFHSFRSLNENEDGLEGSQKLQGPHSANTPSDQS